jgi:protein required for attachment to host cells
MRLRIVVASQHETRFYDTDRPGQPLRFLRRLVGPKVRAQERELPPPALRGASTTVERFTQETQAFVQRIALELEKGRQKGAFDRLALMAAPAFLGLLREQFPGALSALIVAEVRKDLAHQTDNAVQMHLPPEAFAAPM